MVESRSFGAMRTDQNQHEIQAQTRSRNIDGNTYRIWPVTIKRNAHYTIILKGGDTSHYSLGLLTGTIDSWNTIHHI